MDGNNPGLMRFLGDLVLVMAPIALFGYYLRNYVEVVNGPKDLDNSKVSESIRKAYAHWLKTHPDEDFPVFDDYEKYILSDMVFSEDVSTTLNDIGGLDDMINNLMESVILPLRNPELFQRMGHAYGGDDVSTHLYSENGAGGTHELLRAPLGVLLAGPPGTGKTLTARALAKESGAVFISASPSMLQSKWHGESEKLVRALFSVARKLSPSIVFIDEIDVFLAQRGGGAHEVTSRLTGEFLAQWDGVLSGSKPGSVVVIGATNRAFDLDEAVLRRMPRQIYFKLPKQEQRVEIAKVVMSKVGFDSNAEYNGFTGREAAYQFLADHTEGYSGSDLKEACRFAAQVPISEFVRTQREALRAATIAIDNDNRPRVMNLGDLAVGLGEVKRTGQQAEEYREATQGSSDDLSVLKNLFARKQTKRK